MTEALTNEQRWERQQQQQEELKTADESEMEWRELVEQLHQSERALQAAEKKQDEVMHEIKALLLGGFHD